ncbi:MAG: DUF1993 domain-containing protein [Pseudomonadota bacterium]
MNLYHQSIATYRSRLKTLGGLLAKAEAHPEGDALLSGKLAEDMYPLATQIRFVANIPGEALDRMGVRGFESSNVELASLGEAQKLVSQSLQMLETIGPDDLPAPDARVDFSIGDGAYRFEMSAEEYVREFSLPNFYFHLSTAYAILRMRGLELGKADFIPHMMQYFKPPEG